MINAVNYRFLNAAQGCAANSVTVSDAIARLAEFISASRDDEKCTDAFFIAYLATLRCGWRNNICLSLFQYTAQRDLNHCEYHLRFHL